MATTTRDAHAHSVLVQRMARATGRTLTEGPDHRPALEQSEWAASVERCQSCASVGACRSWLEHLELGDEIAESAPGFCNNTALFSRLPAAE